MRERSTGTLTCRPRRRRQIRRTHPDTRAFMSSVGQAVLLSWSVPPAASFALAVTAAIYMRGWFLLRRARVNEIGFEFVSMDLDSRYRLRRILVEALQKVPDNRAANWDGERKV